MHDMSKPIFTILEGGSEDPFRTIELNEESRKYIHVRANNIIKTYVHGEEIKIPTYYDVVRCSDEFMTTEFEKNFTAASSTFDYCVENEEVYFQGTRDSATNKLEHAYVVIEILVCHDEIRSESDPECASDEEIEKWIETK